MSVEGASAFALHAKGEKLLVWPQWRPEVEAHWGPEPHDALTELAQNGRPGLPL